MKYGKAALAILLAAGMTVGAAGCALLDIDTDAGNTDSVQSLTQSQIEEKSQTVATYDGQYTLMVPKGWTDKGQAANEDAILTMASGDGALGMNILSESREDFVQDMTLETFAELSLESIAVENKTLGETSERTLDGCPVILRQITGDLGALRIHYWMYTIGYADAFTRLLFFCVPSDKDKAFPTVETIAQSVHRGL